MIKPSDILHLGHILMIYSHGAKLAEATPKNTVWEPYDVQSIGFRSQATKKLDFVVCKPCFPANTAKGVTGVDQREYVTCVSCGFLKAERRRKGDANELKREHLRKKYTTAPTGKRY